MGWYLGYETKRSLIAEITGDNKCLRHCYRGSAYRGVLWSVWESEDDRIIRCDLLRYDKAEQSWSYKPLDESMEPDYYSCPLGYLRMVPESSQFARPSWRVKVRDYHDPSHAFRG